MSERLRAAAETEGARRFGQRAAVVGFVAGAVWHRARGGDFAAPETRPHECSWIDTSSLRDLASGRRVEVCGEPGHVGESVRTVEITSADTPPPGSSESETVSPDAVKLATAARDMAATSSLTEGDSAALLRYAQHAITMWAGEEAENGTLQAEVERLQRWKGEALTVMAGLQDLGAALGMGLGKRITGETAAEKARELRAERDAARAELAGLREGLRHILGSGYGSLADAYADLRALLTPADAGQDEGRAADAHEREMIEVITERDALRDVADALAAAIAPAEVLGEHSSANCPWQNALDYAAERRPTPPSDDLRERVAEVIEAALWLIGEAWDDGNAAGLDGWTGPGRGAGEVDREAQHARTRMVHKADAALTVLAGREADRG